MRDIEISYLDVYKRLDEFLVQARGGERGVSGYIDRMEKVAPSEYALVPSWAKDLADLKRLRRLRNTIAHESAGSVCTPEDLDLLRDVEERFEIGFDPFSQLQKAKDRAYEALTANGRGDAPANAPEDAVPPEKPAKKQAAKRGSPPPVQADEPVAAPAAKKTRAPADATSGLAADPLREVRASMAPPKKKALEADPDDPLSAIGGARKKPSVASSRTSSGGKKAYGAGKGKKKTPALPPAQKKKHTAAKVIFWLLFAAAIIALAIILEKYAGYP